MAEFVGRQPAVYCRGLLPLTPRYSFRSPARVDWNVTGIESIHPVILSVSEESVWITHLVTGRRTAHRISAAMRVAVTRDRKTEGDGIRCCDSLWVTMCVIHTK